MKHFLIALLLLCAAAPSYAASCRITEYRDLAHDSAGKELQIPLEPAVATQIVSYTTATASAALNSATRFVRIVCTAKAHYKFSVAGTAATANDPYVPVDSPEYYGVQNSTTNPLKINFYDGSS